VAVIFPGSRWSSKAPATYLADGNCPWANPRNQDHWAGGALISGKTERNKAHAAEIDACLAEAVLPHGLAATVRIAE
jgi:hypothetical protein